LPPEARQRFGLSTAATCYALEAPQWPAISAVSFSDRFSLPTSLFNQALILLFELLLGYSIYRQAN
jgi:hypothetical protein